jgi:hypothetical protein
MREAVVIPVMALVITLVIAQLNARFDQTR